MAEHRYTLCPRDGVFFKDGKGWHASASGRSDSLSWPFPPTVLGALRTAWGRAKEQALGRRLEDAEWATWTATIHLRHMLPLRRRAHEDRWGASHRMWPTPEDAFYHPDEPNVQRLLPRAPTVETLGRDEDPARERLARPSLPREKPDPRPPWWTEEEFLDWLAGESAGPRKHGRAEREARCLPRRVDVRVSIESETQISAEGALFSVHTVETLQGKAGVDRGTSEWAIALEADLPDEADLSASPWSVGGDRKLTHAGALDASVFALPVGHRFLRPCAGIRLFVVTPALFKEGWLPDGFTAVGGEYRGRLPEILDDELVLRAALVPRAAHLSGWDMVKRRPKPTLRLVPPGSVYFLTKAAPEASFSAEEIAAFWLAAIGQRAEDGLGRVVAGRWTPHGEDRG